MPPRVRRKNLANSTLSHVLHCPERPPSSVAKAVRGGVICVGAQNFGYEYARYYSLGNKLAYLVTVICEGVIRAGDVQLVTLGVELARPKFRRLRECVRETAGCDLHLIPSSSGEVPIAEHPRALALFNDRPTLASFLFNEESYLETGFGITPQPTHRASDRGLELVTPGAP
jgi:hypothetical protein